MYKSALAALIIGLWAATSAASERIPLHSQDITQQINGTEITLPIVISALTPPPGEKIKTVVLDLGLDTVLPIFANMIAKELQESTGECTLQAEVANSTGRIDAGNLAVALDIELQAWFCFWGFERHIASDSGTLDFAVRPTMQEDKTILFTLEHLKIDGFPAVSQAVEPEPIIETRIIAFLDQLNQMSILPPASSLPMTREYSYADLVFGGESGSEPLMALFLERASEDASAESGE